MKYLLQLSGENINLAKKEAHALNDGLSKRFNNLLIINTPHPCFKRLAFTRKSCFFLFRCKIKNLKNKIRLIDWQKYYKNSFCVRINGKKFKKKEAELADIIWEKIDNPKVRLKNPSTRIEFFFKKDWAFCGILIHENRDKFASRHPKKRPLKHPSTLKPKLAKALVNLSGIKKGKLLDPFCGTGGILIEAALLGYEAIGRDLSENMIIMSKKNLKHYKLKADLNVSNSTKILPKSDLIVTDPPYGRSSTIFKIKKENLYSEFLKLAYKNTKKVVIIFPSTMRFKKILKCSRFNVKDIIKHKVHNSLTRNVVILEK